MTEEKIIGHFEKGLELFVTTILAIIFSPMWVPFVIIGWIHERIKGPSDE
jgi:hypothetical protein